MRYIVLGGGTSDERDVSIRSATPVKEALERLGHSVTYIDPKNTPLDKILEAGKKSDGVFPILHGVGGEDGTLQHELDLAGIKYLGSREQACKHTFNKDLFKELLIKNGIPTPRHSLITADTINSEPLIKAPFVIKPIQGGSSIDTFIIRSLPFDRKPIDDALSRYGTMIIEELIETHEITVGVFDETALPVIEIIPPENGEFDYNNKYNGKTIELCPPKNVSQELQNKAQLLALKVHRLAGCRHLSRTDIMIDADDKLYVIDTNTIPGLTAQSLYPKAAEAAGSDFTNLIQQFTDLLAKS